LRVAFKLPNRRLFILGKGRYEVNEKDYCVKVELSEDTKEYIRQIVREEIAAWAGRLDKGGITFSESVSCLGDIG